MPPCRRCHLAMPQKALLHNPDLARITPVTTTRRICGGKNFDLGSELMVGHKVGLITDAEIPSDGLRRRDILVGVHVVALSNLADGNPRQTRLTADHAFLVITLIPAPPLRHTKPLSEPRLLELIRRLQRTPQNSNSACHVQLLC